MTLTISEVSVCNMALVKLGQEPISSLTQDTKNARLCYAVFAPCRNEVQESHEWYFCTKTVELASIVTEDTLGEFSYLHQLPADFLKPIFVEDEKTEYEIRDDYLMSNYDPMIFKYLYENTNPQSWSYSFAQCLSWRIAAEIAYAVTKSNTVADQMMKGYEMSLKQARYNDAHKKGSATAILDDFIDVR